MGRSAYRLAAVLLALLAGCANGVQIRGSGAAYASRFDDGFDVVNGPGGAGRIEVAGFVDEGQKVSVGLRGTVGGRTYDADEIAQRVNPGLSGEVRTTDVSVEPVVRFYPAGQEATVSPFLEVFVGAAFQEASIIAQFNGQEEGVDFNGAGVVGGAAGGIDIRVADGVDLFLGLELRGAVIRYDEFDENVRQTDFGGFFGVGFNL